MPTTSTLTAIVQKLCRFLVADQTLFHVFTVLLGYKNLPSCCHGIIGAEAAILVRH